MSAVAILSIDLVNPMHYDNAVWHSMAWQWVKFGRMPYTGAWDQNFPGVIFFHIFSILLFGNSEPGFMAFDAALHVAEAVAIFYLIKRWYGARAGFLAAVFSCAIYQTAIGWSIGQRDAYAGMFLVFGALAYYDALRRTKAVSEPKRRLPITLEYLAAGFCLGFTVIVRPTYAGFPATLALVILLRPQAEKLLRFIVFSCGVLLPIGLFMLPYALQDGGLAALYTSMIKFNLDVYGSSTFRFPFGYFSSGKHMAIAAVALISPMLVTLFFRSRRASRPTLSPALDRYDLLLYAGFIATAFASIVVMGKYFRYHFEPLYQLCMPAAAVAIDRILRNIENRNVRRSLLIVTVLLAIATTYPFFLAKEFVAGVSTGHPLEFVRHQKTDYEYEDTLENYRHQKQLVDYLEANSTPQQLALIGCTDPWLTYRWAREVPSRFITTIPLTMSSPNKPTPDYQRSWQNEFLQEMSARDLKFFVTSYGPRQDRGAHFAPAPIDGLMRIPNFRETLDSLYTYDTTIGWWYVYHRK